MKAPRIVRSASLRGRRGIVLLVTGALAMGIGVAGVRALASDSPAAQKHVEAEGPATQTPVVPPAVTDPSPSVAPTQPSPSAEPDPNALADGVYPTYVRAVDVQGATVTVDVLQLFAGTAAHQAAIDDGVPWADVRYDPVYIRNENPLLRTLPVDRDVQIKFIAMCMSPSRLVGLTELRKQTANFNELYYYEMSIVDGSVVAIDQKIAISAC